MFPIRKFRSPDDTATSAGTNEGKPGQNGAGDDANPNPSSAGGDKQSTPATPAEPNAEVEALLSQLKAKGVNVLTEEKFNEKITERLEQQKESAKKTADEAAAKSVKDQLKEAGKLQELADSYKTDAEAKANELATLAEKHTAATTENTALHIYINKQIDGEIKEWPPLVKEFDPGSDNLTARMEWVEKVKKHPEALTPVTPKPGNGSGPRPTGARQDAITSPVPRGRF